MRFIKWCVVACGVSILAVAGAVFVGRQQIPALVAALHLDTCKMPCWIGITPGKTTRGDARRIIQETYQRAGYTLRVLDVAHISVTLTGTAEMFDIALETYGTPADDSRIRQILLTPNQPHSALVGNIFVLVGTAPEDVRLSQLGGAAIRYRESKIFLGVGPTIACDAVSFYQPFSALLLTDSYNAGEITWHAEPKDWRGFDYCYSFQHHPIPE